MSYIVPKEIPMCCGICPCFHAEKLMYCQAVKADKNKRIYAPYGEGRPDWCPLVEIKTPHGRIVDADVLKQSAHLDGQVKTYIDTWIDSQEAVIEAERDENEY